MARQLPHFLADYLPTREGQPLGGSRCPSGVVDGRWVPLTKVVAREVCRLPRREKIYRGISPENTNTMGGLRKKKRHVPVNEHVSKVRKSKISGAGTCPSLPHFYHVYNTIASEPSIIGVDSRKFQALCTAAQILSKP